MKKGIQGRTYYSSTECGAWWTATFCWWGRGLAEGKEEARAPEPSRSSAQGICSDISGTWPVMRCRSWELKRQVGVWAPLLPDSSFAPAAMWTCCPPHPPWKLGSDFLRKGLTQLTAAVGDRETVVYSSVISFFKAPNSVYKNRWWTYGTT